MEQSRQWEKVVLEEEEEIHEVGLRKTKSQHHTATATATTPAAAAAATAAAAAAAAIATANAAAAAAAEFGGVRIEESVDMKEDGRGVINFGDDESDAGFDVTTKFTDIQKSLSTVINYQIGENIRDESLLLNLPTFDEKNHSDERLDVTAKITDIQKSPSDVINPQNGENIRDESLPLNLPTFGEKNPGNERLDVTAKITDIQKSPRDVINHQIGENIRDESLLFNLPTFGEKNHSDERLDVTAKITDIQQSLSTVINYQIGENIRDESLLLNLPTFGEKNHRDERLDVTTKITDIQKSLSTVINYRNGENIRDESLPLSLPTFDVKNHCDERLDVTAKITDIQKSRRDVINYRNGENIRDESLPLTLPTFDESYEDRITSFIPSDTEIIERASIDLIKETYEETEFELGRLLEEPDSHNFYCPNCNACIEKIILLRREQERLLAAIKDLEPRAPVETTYTCTSCYSFLVFIGNQLISIFTPRREEPKGSKMPHTEESDVEPLVPSQGLGIPLPDQSHQPPSNQNAALPVLPLDNGGLAHDTPAPKEVLEGSSVAINVREISENAIRNQTANGHTQYVEENGVATKDPLHGLNGSSLPTEVKVDIREKEDDTMEVNNEDKNNSQGAAFHKESIIEIEENGKQEETFHVGYVDETKGKGSDEPIPSPATQVTPVLAAPEPTISEPENSKKWDILKSIVYGGLIESITSLGIVTSAAGADATTLHILALALANLVGGLFVIGHNLMELRNDQSGDSTTTQTMNETDRYFRQLGERENFKLHATVVVLSFLLFGLVSPVTYGFSFLKSDDKDMKLLAMAAASLLCIALLAIGKAYTQKASSFFGYFKTVLAYVIAGFIASGISYVVGELIKKLLEKLGLFKSSSASTLFLPGTAMAKPGWESF